MEKVFRSHPSVRKPIRRLFPSVIALIWIIASFVAMAQGSGAAYSSRVSVGALRFTSSGPLFLARERGYFAAERLDVEIKFFEAAPTIALAVASGDLTFGSTALTAAFFNLAADGRLAIIAGQAREEKGFPGNLILVTRRAYEAGMTQVPALFGQPFGLTQHGSPSHYQLGQLARALAVPLNGIPIRAFQTLPNLVAALRSDRVSWAIIAPPIAQRLLDSGDVVSLGPYSDFSSYQFGAVFTTRGTLENRADVVSRFLRAYRRGVEDYAALHRTSRDPLTAEAGRARATASIVARYVYPDDAPDVGARNVLASAFFVDPSGAVDVSDVGRQIDWYFDQGLIRRRVEASDIIRLELLRAIGGER